MKEEMVQKAKNALDRVKEILEEKYKPEKIILFGSYACGKFTKDSDIDLLIIKNTNKSRIDRFVEVKRIIYNPETRIPISPIVLTPKELEERINLGDDFLREVVEKGVVIYEG